MAEWLGKPRVKKEDITQYFQKFPKYCQYFEDSPKVRVHIIIPTEYVEKFRKAVIKKYGNFSAGNSNKALQEVALKWIDENG
ncbi:MAG: hypothetical protein HWN66_06710 [Candidatus Helarchaeota archaeon]|nr:hypothetical protein [Candidatus Helarchaeota archaeon]